MYKIKNYLKKKLKSLYIKAKVSLLVKKKKTVIKFITNFKTTFKN